MRPLFLSITIYAALALNGISHAQVYEKELAQKLDGLTKLSDIMRTVKNHYGVGNTQQQIGPNATVDISPEVYRKLKKWARFEWEHQPILNEKGEIPDYPTHLENAMKTYTGSFSGISLMSSGGQWTQVGPMSLSYGHGRSIGSGRIDRIAFHPSLPGTFYVGAPSGGLWRTTDGGSTYTNLTGHLANPSISGIVVDWSNPQVLYILTGDGNSINNGFVSASGYRRNGFGIFKSVNGGATWQQTGNLPVINYRGFRLIQSPTNANVLLAATTLGIIRSTNGGNTWGFVKAGNCWDIAFQPGSGTRVYAAITNGGITTFEISTDGGASFNAISGFDFSIAASNRVSIGVTPANTNRVYLLCGPGNPGANTFFGFYRSTNAGGNFTRTATSPNVFGEEDGSGVDQSTYDNCIGVSPTNADRLWVGGLVVYTSANGGNSFTNQTRYMDGIALERDDHIHPDVHSLAVNPLNQNLYATTDGGVFVSGDNGVAWSRRFNNLPTTQIYHMDVYEPSPHYLAIGNQDNGVQKRFGNTTAFEQTQEGDGFAIQFKNNEHDDFYVVINTRVKRLMSNGLTEFVKWDWTGLNFFPTLAIHPTDNARFYSAKQYFVAYEIKGGIDEWFTRAIPASWAMVVSPSNTSRIYAAGDTVFGNSNSGAMWRSDNGGDTWTTVSLNPGFPAAASISKITRIAVNPVNSNQVWVTLGGTNTGPKVLYSSNAGGNWTNVTGSLPNNLPVNCIVADGNNNVYCGNDFGVFYRAAGWTDWKPFYNGLPRVPVSDLHISTSINRIRAATYGRGVWESDLYTPCDPNLNVSGTREGQHFFDAGATLTTSAKTIKGPGSDIMYRAGNYVQGITGLEVANGSQMRAWTGPCGQGIPTLNFAESVEAFSGYQYATLPMRDGKKFPYAYIRNWKWEGAGQLKLTLEQVTMDTLVMVLVDEQGYKLAEVYRNERLSPTAEETVRLNLSAYVHQKLRLLLFHHNKLVHWQELN